MRSSGPSRFFAAALLAACLCMPRLAAQTVTATVVGSVTDPAAAAVPEAGVTAVNRLTGLTRTAASRENGEYHIASLPPGHYRITVERAGFKRAVIDDVELRVDQVARVDAVLQIGDVAEAVEITAAVPLVSSET
ncbi:MAG: carboxypeptidase-like regulatory domain-containing protein, partial [Bryobacteraceae bacterium]